MWNYLGDDNQSLALACPKCKESSIFEMDHLSQDLSKFEKAGKCWNCNYSDTNIDRNYIASKKQKLLKNSKLFSIGIVIFAVLIILIKPFGFPGDWLQSLAVLSFAILGAVFFNKNTAERLVYEAVYAQEGFSISYEKYTHRMVADGIKRLKISKKSRLVRIVSPEYKEHFTWSENNFLYLIPIDSVLPPSRLSSEIEGAIRIPLDEIDFFMEASESSENKETVLYLNGFQSHFLFGLEDFYILDSIIPSKNYTEINEEYLLKRYSPKLIPRTLAYETMKDMYKMHLNGIYSYNEYLEKRRQILKRIMPR